MNNNLTEKDIMELACGVDEDGDNNGVVKVNLSKLDVTSEKEEIVFETFLDGPVINIFRGYRLTQIDIEFPSSQDFDLMQLNHQLNEFTTIQNSLDEETETIPAIILNIMPKDYIGEYFISALHGSWCLMPKEVGNEISVIRFIFENPLVHVFRVNDTEVDYESIESELLKDNYY